jgi:hypothetical protein
VINLLQLLVLILAALLAVARLLASQREGETALFTSRGATRSQIAGLAAAEVIPLCAAAAAVGALVGIRLAGLVTTAGPLKAAGLTGSPARTWLDAIAAALVVMAIAVAAMLGPVLAGGPAATEARVRRGRQSRIIGATRAGADIALIVLAVLAGWQLRYSAASGSDVTIDPVLVLAPALALAAEPSLTASSSHDGSWRPKPFSGGKCAGGPGVTGACAGSLAWFRTFAGRRHRLRFPTMRAGGRPPGIRVAGTGGVPADCRPRRRARQRPGRARTRCSPAPMSIVAIPRPCNGLMVTSWEKTPVSSSLA